MKKVLGIVAIMALLVTSAFAWIGMIPSYVGYPAHTLCSTSNWEPVCGIDGKTYMNACRAGMNGIVAYKEGICPTYKNVPEYRFVEYVPPAEPTVFEVVFVQ